MGVSAPGKSAVGDARVAIVSVAVIALFTLVYDSITAVGEFTVRCTTVSVVEVPVITALNAFLEVAVPTRRREAAHDTCVRVVAISIVTEFLSDEHEPVSTACEGTVVEALVAVGEIAVVARLLVLYDPVSANTRICGLAGSVLSDFVADAGFLSVCCY